MKDHGYLFLVLQAVQGNLKRKLFLPDLWSDTLINLFDQECQFLSGKVIKMLANLQLNSVPLWLKIEDKYPYSNEEPHELIEALNGFALASRGSSTFLKKLFSVMSIIEPNRLKDMDLSRALLGLSLVPDDKIDLALFDNWSAEAVRRMSKQTQVIDLIAFLQAFSNQPRIEPSHLERLHTLIADKPLNDRNILSLFEVYAKLESLTLATKIKDLLRARFTQMPLPILERIAIILRPRDPQLLRDLSEMAITEESLLQDSALLKELLRILSV